MVNRFHDAHLIIQGACNPSGIARALVSALDEAALEDPSTSYRQKDPACRLITYQLAFLMGMEPLGSPYERASYAEDMALCEKIAALNLSPAQFSTLRAKWAEMGDSKPATFPEFLATVSRPFAGDGCVMVPWCGMMLGIEEDGYAHS